MGRTHALHLQHGDIRRHAHVLRPHGERQTAMLLQIADPSTDHRAQCPSVFGPRAHQSAVQRHVGVLLQRVPHADDQDGVGGDGVDLGAWEKRQDS